MEWKRKPGTWQMTEHTKKGVCYVSFPLLDAERGFVHGFSTRIGGVSEGDLSSMNLSFTRGDDPERVRENYRRTQRRSDLRRIGLCSRIRRIRTMCVL